MAKSSTYGIGICLIIVLAGCNSTAVTLKPLSSSPKAPKAQAEKICEARSNAAAERVEAAYDAPAGSYGGGFAGGFAQGLGNSLDAAFVARDVKEACLARYGWEEVRVPVSGNGTQGVRGDPSSPNYSAQGKGNTPTVSIDTGDRWRMTCSGGQGAMQVPIFARVTKSNKRTGRVDLIVTDRDGIDGTAVAYLRDNTVSLFGETAEWSADGRRAIFKVDVCPEGFLIDRL